MYKCGIDIIEISRIEDAIKKTSGFLEKVFSPEEIAYYIEGGNKTQSLAGAFAAKEAFAKYMGTGLRELKLTDISVRHRDTGAPYLCFCGIEQNVSLTISHNKTTAAAVVCGEELAGRPSFDAAGLLPKRMESANKGDFGKVLVIAGSRGMAGAAAMSAYSALRMGSGLVTLATADCERCIAASFYPEVMTYGLASQDGVIVSKALKDILKLCRTADAVVFGPGLGKNNDLTLILSELIKNYKGKLLIDADGINALSKDPGMLREKTCSVVLTPHPGEMQRLTGIPIDEIQKNRLTAAENFVKEYDVCLVLKGSGTVVSQPQNQTYTNPTGNVGMATAGTGDVLSGVIGSLLGQGLDTYSAAKLGVYIHGVAGDIAKEKYGEYSMTATDVMDNLANAIKGALM